MNVAVVNIIGLGFVLEVGVVLTVGGEGTEVDVATKLLVGG